MFISNMDLDIDDHAIIQWWNMIYIVKCYSKWQSCQTLYQNVANDKNNINPKYKNVLKYV